MLFDIINIDVFSSKWLWCCACGLKLAEGHMHPDMILVAIIYSTAVV